MYIKHKSAMYILLLVITIVDFGFIIHKFYVISNIYATYSKSQIAFHSLSYSKYLQFFNNINFWIRNLSAIMILKLKKSSFWIGLNLQEKMYCFTISINKFWTLYNLLLLYLPKSMLLLSKTKKTLYFVKNSSSILYHIS